jgi:hypothetical protein
VGLFHRRLLTLLPHGCLAATMLGLACYNVPGATNEQAQNQPAPSSAPQHYFLFVVESSRSMQPRLQATLEVMQGLLNTAFNGQMRPGDILDAWAFNETLSKAGPPAQADTQEARATLSVRLLDFVMSQASNKKTSLAKVLPDLDGLLRDSPLITVILITSGENEMHGSVCDGLINNSYKRLHDQQLKAHNPLVTILRAVKGQVTDCKVVPAPARITLPQLPEAQVVQARPPVPASTATAPASVATKPKASVAQTNRPAPVEVKSLAEPRAIEVPKLAAPPSNSPVAAAQNPANTPQPTAAVTKAPEPETASAPTETLPAKVEPLRTNMALVKADPLPNQAEPPNPKAEPPAVVPSPPPQESEPQATPPPAAVLAPPPSPAPVEVAPAPVNRQPAPVVAASLPPPVQRSFLRENGKFLLLSGMAALVAAFCFYNWFKTFLDRARR